eukprot:CAMPEP_0178379604 /NCGR_PEP_ID=MMETSP0689_2-20121128/5030_1 /TAXON_ID=160604 /ORGANISM="Amphidinium massartii, Strain CS-259" /LENGTH=92 /DNA_ID=CAMNT_0019999715 /DNA_START=465 /DNA_END=743 /DNA_ORIENTATION=-
MTAVRTWARRKRRSAFGSSSQIHLKASFSSTKRSTYVSVLGLESSMSPGEDSKMSLCPYASPRIITLPFDATKPDQTTTNIMPRIRISSSGG